jgi:hypothetical protein
MLFFAEPGVRWAIYVLSGRALFKNQRQPTLLEQGDTALIEPRPGGENRVVLEGGGELLLVRIAEHDRPNAVPAGLAES